MRRPEEPSDDPTRVIAAWEARIRRALLIAHVIPPVLGLVTVTALARGQGVRDLDIAIWAAVLAWAAFLLVGGWRRVFDGRRLAGWILADAAVMAALMLIGTPARAVVVYLAIEGALFAAVFLSTGVALAQVGIAYSGLAVAGAMRAAGSGFPEPIDGWLMPLIVTLTGVATLRFLRAALDDLGDVTARRHRAILRRRALLAEAAAEDMLNAELARLERDVTPAVDRLVDLSAEYRRQAPGHGPAGEESRWLMACTAEAGRDLEGLRQIAGAADTPDLEEAIDTAILGASAARLTDLPVARRIDGPAAALTLAGPTAAAVSSFVREAVSNALVHGAHPVTVTARLEASGHLRIDVSDAGDGFDRAAVVRGLGLDEIELASADAGGAVSYAIEPRRHTISLVVDA